jgi:hypothetical protein
VAPSVCVRRVLEYLEGSRDTKGEPGSPGSKDKRSRAWALGVLNGYRLTYLRYARERERDGVVLAKVGQILLN